MAACEMCGASGFTLNAIVESVEMKLCKSCAKYGKVKQQNQFRQKRKWEKPEETRRVAKNAAVLLRQEREKRHMSQEEFATLLQEKESIVAKWENSTLRIPFPAALKIEKKLKISLIKQPDQKEQPSQEKKQQKSSGPPTLGDFVKIKTRKR